MSRHRAQRGFQPLGTTRKRDDTRVLRYRNRCLETELERFEAATPSMFAHGAVRTPQRKVMYKGDTNGHAEAAA